MRKLKALTSHPHCSVHCTARRTVQCYSTLLRLTAGHPLPSPKIGRGERDREWGEGASEAKSARLVLWDVTTGSETPPTRAISGARPTFFAKSVVKLTHMGLALGVQEGREHPPPEGGAFTPHSESSSALGVPGQSSGTPATGEFTRKLG
jgi:hypothetical protein